MLFRYIFNSTDSQLVVKNSISLTLPPEGSSSGVRATAPALPTLYLDVLSVPWIYRVTWNKHTRLVLEVRRMLREGSNNIQEASSLIYRILLKPESLFKNLHLLPMTEYTERNTLRSYLFRILLPISSSANQHKMLSSEDGLSKKSYNKQLIDFRGRKAC